jgi:hypothetical protein
MGKSFSRVWTYGELALTHASTFLIYGTFCFSMFFFVWFLVPETKGLSLERMDDLFGLTEMVKNIEADRENHAHTHATELDMDGKNTTREERKEIVN